MNLQQTLNKIAFVIILSSFTLSSCKSERNQNTNTSETSETVGDETKNVDTSLIESPLNTAEDLVEVKDESQLNESQLKVQQLLKSCVAKDYNGAASVIMYRGADESRIGQDSFNTSNPSEANTVKVTCDVISTWLGTSKSYEFISFQEEETEFGLQYIVEVMFKKEKLGVERHFFYLMDTPKGQMLVNML